MSRFLSYSEIDTMLSCQARHDFRYGDQLAGSSLRSKTIAPLLSAGRAWGAAVAAWHIHADKLIAGELAIEAMDESLDADAEQQRESGVHDQAAHDELRIRLLAMLNHYVENAEHSKWDPIPERRIEVALPSRTGVRSSSRYKFLAFLDATITDDDGDIWLVEVKLRNQLTPASLIVNSRQLRWYAWALERTIGRPVIGAWTHERLHEAPKPPRLVKSRRRDGSLTPSHAKDQLCTADAYVALCAEYGVAPVEETQIALAARKWQQSVPVIFRKSEIEQAGRELVSAAKQIQMLDAGELEPIRNVRRANCSWCEFAEICPAPDPGLIESLFERRPPKRDREESDERGTVRADSGRSSAMDEEAQAEAVGI